MRKSKSLSEQELTGILEEYKTLRDEILNAKSRRMQIISFAIGAFGVILSLIFNTILGSNLTSLEDQLAIAVSGSIILYGIVIPSLIMTISLQQSIHRLGNYIRVFIETKVPGMSWENRWKVHKAKNQLPRGLQGLSAIYLFLSILPLLLPIYILIRNVNNYQIAIVIIPFLFWALYLCYDMGFAKSKGWRTQWEVDGMGIKESSRKLNL